MRVPRSDMGKSSAVIRTQVCYLAAAIHARMAARWGIRMNLQYPTRQTFCETLQTTRDNSLDLIVIVTAAFDPPNIEELKGYLGECSRALRPGGLLFVQGRPEYLPELGVHLDQRLNFKYWIAVESIVQHENKGLPTVHAAVLLFTKGNNGFNISRLRFPHQHCSFCGNPLKDWGGKKHLMHPEGYVISDIWTDLPHLNNYTLLSKPVLETILRMPDFSSSSEANGIIGPAEGIAPLHAASEDSVQYTFPGFIEPIEAEDEKNVPVTDRMFNVVQYGDALELLRRYPDNSIDLVFADPPYNLDKPYHTYNDERDDYVSWCNAWLTEYVRILKPNGSLYVLNLPHWTMYHASFLNRHLYFKNWIVWDALSEPRGKLMPAHYGLLYYTKHPTDFTFNYDQGAKLDARYYCLRASCIRRRKAMGANDKEPLTDFWWNIHRIKHRRDRDYHPCQLPEALMERIIRLSTNPGDIVLDAFSGTGTTAVVASRLGRQYVAIDLDETYVRITRKKVAEVERRGIIRRKSIRKPRQRYTKKELQLELRALATKLGRLPTPEDVTKMSRYDVQVFFDMFPTWGKALKAAKLEVNENCSESANTSSTIPGIGNWIKRIRNIEGNEQE